MIPDCWPTKVDVNLKVEQLQAVKNERSQSILYDFLKGYKVLKMYVDTQF